MSQDGYVGSSEDAYEGSSEDTYEGLSEDMYEGFSEDTYDLLATSESESEGSFEEGEEEDRPDPGTCLNGHALVVRQVPRGKGKGAGCDLCGRRIKLGESMWGCGACNFDKCADCANMAQATKQKPDDDEEDMFDFLTGDADPTKGEIEEEPQTPQVATAAKRPVPETPLEAAAKRIKKAEDEADDLWDEDDDPAPTPTACGFAASGGSRPNPRVLWPNRVGVARYGYCWSKSRV